MSDQVQSFLTDTLIWTGALIALVLLLRRPVARHFGAQAAYALWFVPLLRLAVPPIELPAWLRLAPPPAPEAVAPEALAAIPAAAAAAPAAMLPAAPAAAPEALGVFAGIDFVTPLLTLWLVGAGVFLVRRFQLYRDMRVELLADARPVGETGRIRMVETRALTGPVAFGVRDKVVALPWGFMASLDRARRDLALEHELAHHRGHDLLVNFLVQPLFAMHWCNPLGWAGWRALRRDQEAACDARVVARRSRAERVAYAGLIADFACRSNGAPRAALAAPMACPVLGDKSIIHRLRSLTHGDVSPRRRIAARFGIGVALLALPATASISYAESTPLPPPAPLAPLAPSAPHVPLAPAAPHAPLAPVAPLAPLPPAAETPRALTQAVADAEGMAAQARTLAEDARARAHEDSAHARAAAEHAREAAMQAVRASVEAQRRIARAHSGATRVEVRRRSREDYEELRRDLAEVDREMAELNRELARELGPNGPMQREIAHAIASARAVAPVVRDGCKDPSGPVTSVQEHGRTVMYVCRGWTPPEVKHDLKKLRADLAANPHIPHEERAEALAEIDAEIAEHDPH